MQGQNQVPPDAASAPNMQECMRLMQEGGMMQGRMMDDGMSMMGGGMMMGPMGPWMMGGATILWLLLVILAVLGIAALAKIVFARAKA